MRKIIYFISVLIYKIRFWLRNRKNMPQKESRQITPIDKPRKIKFKAFTPLTWEQIKSIKHRKSPNVIPLHIDIFGMNYGRKGHPKRHKSLKNYGKILRKLHKKQ